MKIENKVLIFVIAIVFMQNILAKGFEQANLSDTSKINKILTNYSVDEHSYDKYINVLSSSPDVAALTRYAEIPVGYYSGIPEISIPLYTIKCGDILFPISLNYYSGGIRVNETASCVGLGWSLMAGGAIKKTNYSSKHYDSSAKPIHDLQAGGEYSNAFMDNYLSASYIPPLYTYNFMGYTGKFLYAFYNNERSYRDLTDSKKLKWTHKYSPFGFFDQKGFLYKFNDIERSTFRKAQYNEPSHSPTYSEHDRIENEAYYLSKIISPNETDSVTLLYTEVSELIENPPIANCIYDQRGDNFYISDENYIMSETSTLTKKLTSINASNGVKVEFLYTSSRLDINYKPGFPKQNFSLDEVKIFNRNNEIIKIFRFKYGYFTSSVLNPGTDMTQNYRLKLLSVEMHGDHITNNPLVYKFEYYGEEQGDPQMPYRTAYSGYDCWGYFNRVPTTEQVNSKYYLFPTLMNNNSTIFWYGDTYGITRTGGDLRPDLAFAQTYTLKKIIYPLGGQRIFKYSLNDDFGGLSINTIINSYGDGKMDSVSYEYSKPIGVDPIQLVRKIEYDNLSGQPVGNDVDLWPVVQKYVLSSCSHSPSSYGGGAPGYTNVREYFDEGFNRYQYYGFADGLTPIEIKSYRQMYMYNQPFACSRKIYTDKVPSNFTNGKISRLHILGKLKSKITYDINRNLKSESYYWYTFKDKYKIPAMEVNCESPVWSISGVAYYDFNTSEIIIGEAILDSVYNATYDKEGSNTLKSHDMTERYTYNSEQLVDRKSILNSDGKEHTTSFLYPFNSGSSPIYSTMTAKNMMDYPLQITQRVNNTIYKGEKIDYASFSGKIFPFKFYSYEVGKGFDENIPQYTIKSYNSKGKPQEIIGKDNLPVVYLWGYNSQYPIAKIVGKTIDLVKQSLPQYESWEGSFSITPSILKTIREAFPQKGTIVTTYLYDKLGNIIEETASNNVTTYYEYDLFGRLIKVKNQDGVTLTEHQYNHQNQ